MDTFITALKRNGDTLIILAFVLSNFLIKGFFLSSNSLGGDEPFSVYHAQMDIASIIKLLSEGNNPPLYEIILHFWIQLFGISEFSVRFPSLIFSCITVVFIYKLGNKFLNKRSAIYASIIFLVSNYQIVYAHEARAYALLGMLSAMSMFYFLGVINSGLKHLQPNKEGYKREIKRQLVLLLIINVLLIYTHYFGFFILITQFLYLLLNRKIFIRFWKQIGLAIGILIFFYLPNLIVIYKRFIDASSGGTWVEAPNGITSLYSMIRRFSNAPVVAVAVLSVFVFALVMYFIRKRSKPINFSYGLIVFWFLFIFFFMFGISYTTPIFLDRYLMPCEIGFCLLLGISLDYILQKPKIRYIIPGIVCLLFIATVKPNITNKRNVEEAVLKVKELMKPNTLVIICPKYFVVNFTYYFDQTIFKNYSVEDIYSNMDSALSKKNIFAINTISDIDFKKWEHIVYLDAAADFAIPNNNIKNVLNKEYSIEKEYNVYEIYNIFDYKIKQENAQTLQ